MSEGGEFAFLRPLWLLGYLPLGATVLWWRRAARRRSSAWEKVVDPDLAPHVIEPSGGAGGASVGWLFGGWALALLALSGPTWEWRDVPVHEVRGAQVIVLDLSRSMLADDLAPDRLTRARFKIEDLLGGAGGMRTGLVAFAERPYVIGPLTDDAATLEAFLPSLTPSVVPAQGSRADLAIALAVELLERGGAAGGHVILVTDAVPSAADVAAAEAARAAGHRLSVLGVGTPAGAPLRDAEGRFVRSDDGAIAVPQLDMAALGELAAAGGGVGVALTSDGRDLEALGRVRTRLAFRGGDEGSAEDAQAYERFWVERSPWLLFPLALLALGLFRRGVVS